MTHRGPFQPLLFCDSVWFCEIPHRPGKPWQRGLDVSSLPCSHARSRGTRAGSAEAMGLLGAGDAGHSSLARRLGGFQDSKLFVQIKLRMWKKKPHNIPWDNLCFWITVLRSFSPNNAKLSVDIKERKDWITLILRYCHQQQLEDMMSLFPWTQRA